MEEKKQVVIVGAGIAGMVCARVLQENHIDFLVVEASDRAGGRIKTDLHESGFRLDRGFQVLLNSYPELPAFFDLKRLNLKKFKSGAKVFDGQKLQTLGNPLRHPFYLASALCTPLATLGDKFKVVILIIQALTSAGGQKPQPTVLFLKSHGFSPKFIEGFWRPFFSGVFLDSKLSVNSDFFLFLLRCFSLGSVSLPENGMEALPLQLSQELGKNRIRYSQAVSRMGLGFVELETGPKISADIVVKAFQSKPSESHSAMTYYFSTSAKLDFGKWLILIPADLGFQLNHLIMLSEISKLYAPEGQSLISASTVKTGVAIDIGRIMAEIEIIAGTKLNLRHLRTDFIPDALPLYDSNAPDFLKTDFGYECGDHLSSPSINGAIRSGRLVGEAIVKELALKR